jgi:hypothetical protein
MHIQNMIDRIFARAADPTKSLLYEHTNRDCAYRSHDGQRACFVGVLIDDAEYDA